MSDSTLLNQLDEQGYVVVRNVLDRATTAAIRATTDALGKPILPPEREGVDRLSVLRHPLEAALLAWLATYPRLVELALATLRIQDVRELRLVEQVLIRTDPSTNPPGPTGWHID